MTGRSRTIAGGAAILVTTIAGHAIGIPADGLLQVVDHPAASPVPGAPGAIRGVFALRNRIATMVDMRRLLGLSPASARHARYVVVSHAGHLYALMVDTVEQVTDVGDAPIDAVPSTIDPLWREMFPGLLKSGERLILVLDLDRALAFPPAVQARGG